MNSTKETTIALTCPCCNARLTIDAQLGQVVAHEAAPKNKRSPEHSHLERASEVLERQAERREARFRESADQVKIKSDLLSRKFEEELKKTRGEPVTRPQREIDLD